MKEELGFYHTAGQPGGPTQLCVRCGKTIPSFEGEHLPEGTNVREHEDIRGGQIQRTEWLRLTEDEISGGAFVACE